MPTRPKFGTLVLDSLLFNSTMPSSDMPSPEAWYIVKQPDGHCQILSTAVLQSDSADRPVSLEQTEHWGPFDSQAAAIARRVGLIRAGKCQPV